MRNLKKFLAVLVVVAMMATTMMTAFAADPYMTPAQKAEGLGILKGGANGVDDEYLGLETQRIQTAIVYLRLLGLEDTARKYTATTENFADSNLVSGDTVNLMAYLKANPNLGWIGDGTNFSPLTEVTGQALYKVMLTSVGYVQGLDFDYSDTIGYARAMGFALASTVGGETVTNGSMAVAMMEALQVNLKGKTTTLAADLVAKKVITQENAVKYGVMTIPAVTVQAITSVTSDNLIQLNVKFAMALDATKGVDVANYTVKVGTATKTIAAGGIKLSADKMTATILLAAGLTQSDVVTVTYAKAAAGTTADLTATSAAIVDTTVPTVKSVTVTGTKMLTVVFSEPVQNATSIANYTIDGSVYSGVAPTLSKDGLTATVLLAQRIIAGTHKVVVKTAVMDYASIPVSPNSTDITVAVDTTAPTAPVVVGDATQTKVVVQFPEAIDTIGAVSANAATFTADATDKSLWTITWTYTTPLPAATSTITFTDVMDMSANTAATLTLSVTPVVDAIRPALAATPFVQQSESSFTVEFTKEVQMIGTYTLKNKDGNINTVTPSAFSEGTPSAVNKKKVLLTTADKINAASGPYTLNIKGEKDNTALTNEFVETTQTVTFVDKTTPTFDFAYSPAIASGVAQTVYAVFSEALDAATATTAANYTMISTGASKVTALPSNASLELIGANKMVKITIPAKADGTQQVASADFASLNVSGVKDVALNAAPVKAIALTLPTITAATIQSAKVTAEKEIKIALDYAISTVSQTDFVITSVNATPVTLSAVSASLSADGLTVTLAMNDKIRADAKYAFADTANLKVALNANAGAANVYGVKMNTIAANITGFTAVDAFAPTASAVANAYTDKETYTSIKLKVSEDMANVATNESSQFTVVINNISRTISGITYAAATSTVGATMTLTMADYTDIFNKAYTVTFAPVASSNFRDAAGAPSAANTNALKGFTFTGTVGNTP